MVTARKHTVFEPCEQHAAIYAAESRYRRAEAMCEGGWGGWAGPCKPARCRMLPGTDFYAADFVAGNPVYYVGTLAREPLTYGEALELAAALYSGARLAEMAMTGYPRYELPRVPEADRPAMAAMIADLTADHKQVQALTRRGREAWPAGVLLGW